MNHGLTDSQYQYMAIMHSSANQQMISTTKALINSNNPNILIQKYISSDLQLGKLKENFLATQAFANPVWVCESLSILIQLYTSENDLTTNGQVGCYRHKF